ncbi:hypothetical protein NW853_03055 [Synechococcus sp. H55.11]
MNSRLFPKTDLARATAEVLAEDGDNALNYGGTFAGLIEVVLQLMPARGVEAQLENLLIGHRSGQILGLLPQVFVEPGDVVIVEGPTFMGAVSRFAAFRAGGTESFVIALLGAAVNRPRGSWLACQLQGLPFASAARSAKTSPAYAVG